MKKIKKTILNLIILVAFVFLPMISNAQSNYGLIAEMENNMGEGSDFIAKNSFKINSSGVAVMSSSQINSEKDLDIFSDNVSRKNDEVANVDINSGEEGESEVKVIYRHKGKFLGLIPITIKSTTVVETTTDEETEVRSNLSWWSFLVTEKNHAKDDIESSIKNNTTIKSNTMVNASAEAKAKVAEVVIAEVRASANTQISIDK